MTYEQFTAKSKILNVSLRTPNRAIRGNLERHALRNQHEFFSASFSQLSAQQNTYKNEAFYCLF